MTFEKERKERGSRKPHFFTFGNAIIGLGRVESKSICTRYVTDNDLFDGVFSHFSTILLNTHS